MSEYNTGFMMVCLVGCVLIIQVAHPLLRDQLLLFISHGFLRPQMGPALFQVLLSLSLPSLTHFNATHRLNLLKQDGEGITSEPIVAG